MLPERLEKTRHRRDRRGPRAPCSELEILVDGDHDHAYLLQIFLKESAGLYGDPKAGPFFYEIIQRKGDRGFGAGNFRALFESIEREQRRRSGLMLDRVVAGEVPRKHHIALRGADGELRYEECLTRDGFDGPYTILYHLRRPHLQRAGRGAPRLARRPSRRPASSRSPSVTTSRRACRRAAARRSTRASRCCSTRIVTIGVARPTAPDPVYFANADGDELFFVHARRRRGALAARRSALRAGRLRATCPRACCTASSPTRRSSRTGCGSSARATPSPAAVAQRGRPAPHGRAVLAPRLPAAGVRRARATRASATWS